MHSNHTNMGSNHTIESPLKLIWDCSTYKVNKPNQETQELVSLDYAVAIIAEHQLMKETLEKISSTYREMNTAGKVASKTLKQITL